MSDRKAELRQMLSDLVLRSAVAEVCSAASAQLSSGHLEQGDWIDGLRGCNVPRGTLRSSPHVPRGTLHEKLNVPRGTLSTKPALDARKGISMAQPPIQSNKPKSRLGRGLSSLISVSELPVEVEVAPSAPAPATSSPSQPPAENVRNEPTAAPTIIHSGPAEIPVDSIAPNPHQPRREMNEVSLAALAASLKSSGLIQPIIVRKVDAGYQLIAGERRLRASKLAGMKTIPAIVRDVDSFTQAQMALIENIQREDLNPIDRALAYRALMNQLGLKHQELAIRMGEDRSSITNFVRLLDLAEPVREMIRTGQLSMGHAKLLGGVPDILEQQRLAELCVSQDLSVRNLERLLSTGGKEPEKTSIEKGSSSHLLDLEKTIARQLGMRVQVRSSSKSKGRLVIHYASLDQFDDLLKRLDVRVD